MSQLSFGIRIAAKDETQGTLRGALAGFKSFAHTLSKPITIPLKIAGGALGLARDINLGLRPMVHWLDEVIEKGARFSTITKSFRSWSGLGDIKAGGLARELVAASHGGLQLSKTMELANRAAVSGLSITRDLPTVFDFAARKAATTGMAMDSAMDRIITGLSRASAPILDDFGLMQEGIEGVQRRYEALKGAGAWKDLSPAAQKAEFIRQAMSDIREQMGKIGVSGRETIFVFQGLVNQVRDARDQLFGAIAGSKGLRDVLKEARDAMAGIAEHIERGGKLQDILFGKKDGKSGGLLGGLKAGLQDLGEGFGHALIGGGLKAILRMQGAFDEAWSSIRAEILSVGEEFGAKLTGAFQPLTEALGPLLKLLGREGPGPTSRPTTTGPSDVALLRSGLGSAGTAAPGIIARDVGTEIGVRGIARGAGAVARQAAAEDAAAAAVSRTASLAGDVLGAAGPRTSLLGLIGRRGLGLIAKGAVPGLTIADLLYTG